jgi:hypothetical protein
MRTVQYKPEEHDELIRAITHGEDIEVLFDGDGNFIRVQRELIRERFHQIVLISRDPNGLYRVRGNVMHQTMHEAVADYLNNWDIDDPDFVVRVATVSRYYDPVKRKWIPTIQSGDTFKAAGLWPDRDWTQKGEQQ